MSKTQGDDIAFITALAALLRDSDLSELEVKRDAGDDGELSVRLTRTLVAAPPSPVVYTQALPVQAPGAVQAAAVAGAPEDPAEHPGAVTSPMVGTIYTAPEPGSPPYVRVGDAVDAGQTLLIIEAMKTMNQIPAPRSGTVRRILIEDKQPVEYGAPLMIID